MVEINPPYRFDPLENPVDIGGEDRSAFIAAFKWALGEFEPPGYIVNGWTFVAAGSNEEMGPVFQQLADDGYTDFQHVVYNLQSLNPGGLFPSLAITLACAQDPRNEPNGGSHFGSFQAAHNAVPEFFNPTPFPYPAYVQASYHAPGEAGGSA